MLELQLAALKDMQQLVSTTYELEGDQLEILLFYDRVHRLRALGDALRDGALGVLPNVDRVLRSNINLRNGTETAKKVGVAPAS